MSKSSIEWTDFTLNPFVGCSKCSPGCQSCFAERFAARLAKNPNPKISSKYASVIDDKGGWTGHISNLDLSCFDKLSIKSKRVFVGSMTDLFHGNVPCNYIEDIFKKVSQFPQHTFLFLTKRPQHLYRAMPYLNAMFGVTVCNQQEADEKIPQLLDFPTSRPFISVEPMLEKIDIRQYLDGKRKLSWVICGGETGPNARPMHEAWVKSLRDQCLEAGTPYFFKSWGEWLPCTQVADDFDNVEKYPVGHIEDDGLFIPPPALEIPWRNHVCGEDTCKVGKKRSGYLIDGVEYRQFPEG